MYFKAEQSARAAWERLQADVTCFNERRSEEDKQADRDTLSHWRSSKQEMDQVLKSRGLRYKDCSFDTFEVTSDEQAMVVEALKLYAQNAGDNLKLGRNVLLLGPRGSGKDHLLIALAKAVFSQTTQIIHWENGMDWFENLRKSAIGQYDTTDRRLMSLVHRNTYGQGILNRNEPIETQYPIFVVSDPLPPCGPLTEFQQASLFRVIDGRYSRLLPTWMSMNVADGPECEKRMGAQTVDRLRDGALVLFCNWESHRRAIAT